VSPFEKEVAPKFETSGNSIFLLKFEDSKKKPVNAIEPLNSDVIFFCRYILKKRTLPCEIVCKIQSHFTKTWRHFAKYVLMILIFPYN
jgi:hypothetical protein